MYIAASKIILDFYGNSEVAKKTKQIQQLVALVRGKKHNVSIAEVEDFNDPERCVMGLVLVAQSQSGARALMKKCLEYIDDHSFARVIMEDTQVSKF